MPLTHSAKKALRVSKRKAIINATVKDNLSQALRLLRKKPGTKSAIAAIQAVDRSWKAKIIHKNKAARLKSRLSSFLKKKPL